MNNFRLSQSLCHYYLFVWEPDINKTLSQTEIRIPYKWKPLDGCCHIDLLSPSLSFSVRAFQIGKLHLHSNKTPCLGGFSVTHFTFKWFHCLEPNKLIASNFLPLHTKNCSVFKKQDQKLIFVYKILHAN